MRRSRKLQLKEWGFRQLKADSSAQPTPNNSRGLSALSVILHKVASSSLLDVTFPLFAPNLLSCFAQPQTPTPHQLENGALSQ